MRKSEEEAKDLGVFGENVAAEHLIKEGYVIRERNWRCVNKTEIDIIAQTGTTIVFVEVKSRSGTFLDPLDAVTPGKIRKIVSAANSYMKQQDYDLDVRFDIITVKGSTQEYQLEHIPDAFLPPLRGWK